ncbi:hypothetical protein DL93DRAFT_2077678 [Clavulina sp. PMI_390]|nr:hypothetical protein DL93DRAFT_2077678 [Clavulina sp. PMI_390]
MTPEKLAHDIKNGTIKLADIEDRIHKESFKRLARNPSRSNIHSLRKLQEYIEKESDVGKRKLVRKPSIVKDPHKHIKKTGSMVMMEK